MNETYYRDHWIDIEPERCELVFHAPLVSNVGVLFASDHFGLRVTFRANGGR